MDEAFLVLHKNGPESRIEVICFNGARVDFDSSVFSTNIFETIVRYSVEKICGLNGEITQVAAANGFDNIEFNQAYLQSEAMIGALQHTESVRNQSFLFFLMSLDILCRHFRVPSPRKSAEQILTIQNEVEDLLNQWEAVPVGQALELPISRPINRKSGWPK